VTTTTAPYSRPEEFAHALTAGLGIVACAVAIPWLAWVSFGDPWRLTTALVFGVTALGMFVTSVVYHWARHPELKLRLRKLDHSAIYLLIAGTYTPFALVAMAGAWGWTLFGVVWAIAIFGVVAKNTAGFRYPKVWKSRRYTHAVWHLFVLAGVACHFVAVLSVVTTPAG
jgi:hemolysin III